MSGPEHIPFNRPFVTGAELEHMAEAMRNAQLAGNGPFAARCREWLERSIGSRRALLTHSCTGALELAFTLAEIGPGDEVVMPSFTFVSTANAVVAHGGTPVFVDIRPDTLCLDEGRVAEAIGERTKAVVPVHYAGVGCPMDAIMALAREHGLRVIEDAAHGVNATRGDRALGGIGDLGTLSFHETKNVSCGEGGALLVNDASLVERAEIVYEKGTDRARFFRGQVDKYTWVDVGSSYAMSDLAAAYLWAQLERADEITAMRLDVWNRYHEALAEHERQGVLRRPVVPDDCTHNAHLYYVLVDDLSTRSALIESLSAEGINAIFHYVPLHSAPAGLRFGRTAGGLDVTESVADRLVRLPLWPGLGEREVERVVGAVTAFFERGGRGPSDD